MVNTAGIISTVVGNNGAFANPDGLQGTSTGFSIASGMTFDSAGNLYIGSQNYATIYKLSGGIIRRIAGASSGPLTDGTPALSTYFYPQGMKIDSNGDLYAVDSFNNTVRKLIANSPVSLSVTDGNSQTGTVGQLLSKALKVQLNGRAGLGVSGATVNFAVASGSATLSSASTITDSTGVAGVAVTLGTAAGTVVITASVPGTTLPGAQFTETATAACAVPQPVITSVNSAGDFGGSTTFAPGSWLEIKGTNLSQTTRLWAGGDFSGTNAPTSLDGVTATIDGKSAFVEYISPLQVNVQAPADAATGAVQITITTSSCSSAAFTATEAAAAPGLLAPSSFNIGGKQYLVALFPDGVTYVGNANLIPGVPFRPAAPGDIITAYGIGFGAVTPAVSPGAITGGSNAIPNLSISFGTTAATIAYAGLAPNVVGEYQFTFVVPNVPDGDYPIVVQDGSVTVPQTVYLTVHQ